MRNGNKLWIAACSGLLAVLMLASCSGTTTTNEDASESASAEQNASVNQSASEDGACVHEAETDPAIEATCTEVGLSEGSHCAKCGETLVAQEEVPALGHSFENGACTVCKQKEPSVGLSFQVNNNELAVIGIGSCSDTQLVIPESDNGKFVTFIQNGALSGCENIESVFIPGSVTSIGSEAFKGCTKLQSAIVPADVMFFGENAFAGCTALTDIWCVAEAQPDTWTAGWLGDCSATIHWGDSWEYVDGVPTAK